MGRTDLARAEDQSARCSPSQRADPPATERRGSTALVYSSERVLKAVSPRTNARGSSKGNRVGENAVSQSELNPYDRTRRGQIVPTLAPLPRRYLGQPSVAVDC